MEHIAQYGIDLLVLAGLMAVGFIIAKIGDRKKGIK